jgi:hypothetical protein
MAVGLKGIFEMTWLTKLKRYDQLVLNISMDDFGVRERCCSLI